MSQPAPEGQALPETEPAEVTAARAALAQWDATPAKDRPDLLRRVLGQLEDALERTSR